MDNTQPTITVKKVESENVQQIKEVDPILDSSDLISDKYVIGEIQNHQAYAMYKKALAAFWVADSIDCEEDNTHFQRLSANEKAFILNILAFFAGSDGIVLENLVLRFYNEVQQPEVRLFYGLQVAMENIHSEVYSDLIRSLVKDKKKRKKLFKSIDGSNAVRGKAVWAEKWIQSDRPFCERLVAFAAVEGILFSSSFCAIFYLRKRGHRLPGLYQSNEYISRDEGMHCEFACMLHKQLRKYNQCSQETILEIVKSAVEVEETFIKETLAEPIIGMNAPVMIEYVHFVADVLLQMLNCEKHYKTLNPFPFMESISIENKTNFFERKVTDYSLSDVTQPSSVDDDGKTVKGFSIDEDF